MSIFDLTRLLVLWSSGLSDISALVNWTRKSSLPLKGLTHSGCSLITPEVLIGLSLTKSQRRDASTNCLIINQLPHSLASANQITTGFHLGVVQLSEV